MRRRRRIFASLVPVLVAAVLGLGFLVGLGLAGMLTPHQDETISVHRGTDYTKTIDLGSKAIVEGFMMVRNGNNDIRFAIENPEGQYVYERYILAAAPSGGFSTFSYKAETPGPYTLHFDNRSDPTISKLVFWHYRVRYNSLW